VVGGVGGLVARLLPVLRGVLAGRGVLLLLVGVVVLGVIGTVTSSSTTSYG